MPNRVSKYIIGPIAAIVIFVALAELILFIFNINPHPKGHDFTVNRAPDFPEVFLRDHDLLWRLRPAQTITSEFFLGHTYRINAQGFRGNDFELEKTALRLAVLGNSCAFGWRVKDDQTFADILERKLQQTVERDADVLNFSVPGYSSFQGRRNYIDKVKPYKPDILLVTFAWNDHWLAANEISDKDQRMPPGPVLVIQNTLARFRFYRLLKAAIFSLLPEPGYMREKGNKFRVEPADYQTNLADIVKTAKGEGTRVIFLTSPMPSMEAYYDVSGKSALHETHRYYNDLMRQTAANHSVGLIDLAAIFDQHDNLFDDVINDPFHYNSRGQALAAEEIFQFLVTTEYFTGEKQAEL